jgi:glycoside/pentoside/hexuronide:cation symporter, GPH family
LRAVANPRSVCGLTAPAEASHPSIAQETSVTSTTAAAPEKRLPLFDLLAFSTPGLPIGALAVALTVYLPHYYAAHFGLSLAAVGAAFSVVRLIDMAFDPGIGIVMDRTVTRFGRYRLWLVIGAPILMLAVYMLFSPPGKINNAYLIGWLFIYYIGTSIIGLSHSAWASVIAGRYHERSRVFGVMQVVAIIGATAVLVLPIVMAGPGGASGAGDVPAMGMFVIITTPIGVLLALARTPERIVREVEGEKFKLRDYWEMVARPDMRRIIFADFCLALGPGWMSAMYLFYFHDARGFSLANSSKLLGIYIIAGVFGAGILSWVAQRLGKHTTLMLAAAGYSIGLVGLSFLPQGAFGLVALAMFLLGFLASSFALLDRAMVADVGDAVRLEQGKNRTGLLYAMITSSQKIASGLSIGLTFTILGLVGYQPKEGAVNTHAAIEGLKLVYLCGPVFFVMLGGACFIGYKLDHKRHSEIRAALDARDAMSPEPSILEGIGGPAHAHSPSPAE